jgi:2-hydroxy-3-oxopropionate reductase
MGTSDQVEERILGHEGIIHGLSPGKVIIDFGTSLPSSTKKIAEKIADTGAAILDAPLGRTPHHAKEGLLNIMAAGDKNIFDKVSPILKNLGENVFYLGGLGTGHTIKLMNNFFGMTIANAMAEVFAVADVSGVSRETVYKVISAGPLHSSMMDFISAFGLEGDKSKLEFAVKNAHKDVNYYRLMTEKLGIDSIMSESANKALTKARDSGYDEAMVCEMIDFFKNHYSADKI